MQYLNNLIAAIESDVEVSSQTNYGFDKLISDSI